MNLQIYKSIMINEKQSTLLFKIIYPMLTLKKSVFLLLIKNSSNSWNFPSVDTLCNINRSKWKVEMTGDITSSFEFKIILLLPFECILKYDIIWNHISKFQQNILTGTRKPLFLYLKHICFLSILSRKII